MSETDLYFSSCAVSNVFDDDLDCVCVCEHFLCMNELIFLFLFFHNNFISTNDFHNWDKTDIRPYFGN